MRMLAHHAMPRSLGALCVVTGCLCMFGTPAIALPARQPGGSIGSGTGGSESSDPLTGGVPGSAIAIGAVDPLVTMTPPAVSTGEATELQVEGSAKLEGTVNPEGETLTSCEFEYGTEVAYGQTAPCVPAPGTGTSPVAVHAALSGLTPGTLYHYRLVAANAEVASPGADRTFIAPTHPRIDGESAADVASSSATLAAQIDPGGSATT